MYLTLSDCKINKIYGYGEILSAKNATITSFYRNFAS